MNDAVLNIISEIAKKSPDELQQSMDAEGLWDSLLHVELVFALEAEFDIFFNPDEIAQINTPAKVINVIKSKVATHET